MKIFETHEHIFKTREEAEKVLNNMKEIIDTYASATVADFKDLVDRPGVYGDTYYRWTSDTWKSARVMRDSDVDGWVIVSPMAKDNRAYVSYSGRPSIRPTTKPIYITINYDELDDPEAVMADLCKHVYAIADREVHITIT